MHHWGGHDPWMRPAHLGKDRQFDRPQPGTSRDQSLSRHGLGSMGADKAVVTETVEKNHLAIAPRLFLHHHPPAVRRQQGPRKNPHRLPRPHRIHRRIARHHRARQSKPPRHRIPTDHITIHLRTVAHRIKTIRHHILGQHPARRQIKRHRHPRSGDHMVDNQLAGRSKGNHPQRFKLMPVTASRKLSARSLSTANPPPRPPAAQQNPKS